VNILVTGGLGYIGSHLVVGLVKNGFSPLIIDDLSTSKTDVLDKINKSVEKEIPYFNLNISNFEKITNILKNNEVKAVFHLAGFKSVKESINNPSKYYDNNVKGTLNLLKALETAHVKKIIFSSSASVYGDPIYLPIDEEHPLNPKNPYAESKMIIENHLKKLTESNSNWKAISLRYFNPIGSHDNKLLGDRPSKEPDNIMPLICKVALGDKETFKVFGNDYKTKDGTGVRDYIHIQDLVDAHISCLKVFRKKFKSLKIFNVGTGEGYSVLEILKIFSAKSNKSIPYSFEARREGDVDISYAKVKKIFEEIGWKAERSLEDMCLSAWEFNKSK
tara:strand:- start:2334 stop:3332 length:999 start_codon:yes stop_codon:yes gene_type:complete